MTDPFKNQRYDMSTSHSLPHTSSPQQHYTKVASSLNPQASSSLQSFDQGSFIPKSLSNDNKQTFIQAHIESNRELINQLKNNIELLFRGTKYLELIYHKKFFFV